MLNHLEVFTSPYPKIRIGSHGDGGYVIAWDKDLKYDLLLSGGVAQNIDFEDHFLNSYRQLNPDSDIHCFAFDGSVNNIPDNSNKDKIHFVKKMIGPKNNHKFSNLKHLINNHQNIFLKMDIERGEYPWFKSLSHNDIKHFKQIAIEFHHPLNWDVIKKINKTHKLIHFHGNNCNNCITIKHNGKLQKIPKAFECTFIRKDNHSFTRSFDPIPGPLDNPNKKNTPDITLCGYPFNNKSYQNPLQKFKKNIIFRKRINLKKPINTNTKNDENITKPLINVSKKPLKRRIIRKRRLI